MSTNSRVGRHRADVPFSPLAELAGIAARTGSHTTKVSAAIVAGGGLVATVAAPAQASAPASIQQPTGPSARTTVAPVVVAPAVTAPVKILSFGVTGVKAVAKPRPRPVVVAPVVTEALTTRQAVTTSRTTTRTHVPTTTVAPPPASAGVLGIARTLLGIPYVYGGTTTAGFDCSGFTSYVFRQVGKSLPRTAEDQRRFATPVSNPQPGDLVFWGAPAWHVGIYAGNGMAYEASTSSNAIVYRALWGSGLSYGRV